MKKILAAAAVACSAALAPPASLAGPVYTLYAFEVQTWGCVTGGPACGGYYGPNSLEGVGVGIGVEGSTALLDVSTTWGGDQAFGYYENTNVALAHLSSVGTPVDLSRGVCLVRVEVCQARVAMSVLESGGLTGSMRTLNGSEWFEMTGDASGLWTGRYTSDLGHRTDDYYIVYSGVWRAVPEPATLALAGLAGLGALVARRRRPTA